MSQILLAGTTLHAETATGPDAMGNMIIGREPGYTAATPERGLPAAGAFAVALAKDEFVRPCELYGNVPCLNVEDFQVLNVSCPGTGQMEKE